MCARNRHENVAACQEINIMYIVHWVYVHMITTNCTSVYNYLYVVICTCVCMCIDIQPHTHDWVNHEWYYISELLNSGISNTSTSGNVTGLVDTKLYVFPLWFKRWIWYTFELLTVSCSYSFLNVGTTWRNVFFF